MARCRSCQRRIVWARTDKGDKPIPLDPGPAANANLTVVRTEGATPIVAYVAAGDGDHVSHFATCPQAAEHRRR